MLILSEALLPVTHDSWPLLSGHAGSWPLVRRQHDSWSLVRRQHDSWSLVCGQHDSWSLVCGQHDSWSLLCGQHDSWSWCACCCRFCVRMWCVRGRGVSYCTAWCDQQRCLQGPGRPRARVQGPGSRVQAGLGLGSRVQGPGRPRARVRGGSRVGPGRCT